ncbi:MAG: thioredoxin family protein [Syntrophobacteraceae bacterium]|jgi:thioredoxin 1
MNRIVLLVVSVIFGVGFGLSLANGQSSSIPDVPVKGIVTMVDIGAHKCIPCKMMAPILESLEKEYKSKAAIVFIDVWENREQGQRFGIRSIPTQIFYDKDGKEVYRHQGFLSRDDIVAKLEELGVKAEYSNKTANSNL